MEIEFTDRYGGNPPSWLRGCFGDCEATGFYPICNRDKQKGDLRLNMKLQEPNYSLWWKAHNDALVHDCDGWHFVKCNDCHGFGRVSWWITIGRIPRWIIRGVRFMFSSPVMGNKRTIKDIILAFKCAFLADLKLWKP